jgi:Skp family chaperone for outer membrane proteins
MRISQLGWVLAAAIVGIEVGGGFQAKTNKTGYIDLQEIYNESKLKAKNDEKLNTAAQSRRAAFDFMRLNPEFTADQLARFKALIAKEIPTPAEVAELTKLKETVQTSTNQFDDLRKKPNPTPDDIKRLNTLGELHDANVAAQRDWDREFSQQLESMQADMNVAALDSMKAALAQVAKAQGYTLVFRENVAVYGANNVGADVKKIVDKNTK